MCQWMNWMCKAWWSYEVRSPRHCSTSTTRQLVSPSKAQWSVRQRSHQARHCDENAIHFRRTPPPVVQPRRSSIHPTFATDSKLLNFLVTAIKLWLSVMCLSDLTQKCPLWVYLIYSIFLLSSWKTGLKSDRSDFLQNIFLDPGQTVFQSKWSSFKYIFWKIFF